MALLCPNCGRNQLEITLSDMPNFVDPGSRPEIVSIECKAYGTGNLTKCRFPQGSVEFSIISELYWLGIENSRAIKELMNRQSEYLSSVMFKLYHRMAEKETSMLLKAEGDMHGRSASEKALPGMEE